jgi:GxxExxY protein
MPEAYRDCLALELRMREIIFKRDHPMPIVYKGHRVDGAMRVDFLIEESVIVTTGLPDLGETTKNHMKNVLRLTGVETGLLVNFNVDHLRDGVKRIIVSELPPALHYQS